MPDPPRQRQVPFLAPLLASVAAPVADTARRAAMPPPRSLAEVTCRACGEPCALLDPQTRLLHTITRDGGVGAPLAAAHDVNAPVRCDRCGATRHISGRAVFYRLRRGEPLLPA